MDFTDRSFKLAIAREIEEETGLIIDTNRFVFLDYLSVHPDEKSDYTVWYSLTLTDGEIPLNIEPEKHTDWTLCPLAVAKTLPLMHDTLDVLNSMFEI